MSALTDYDRRIIAHARELAQATDLEAVRKAASSAAGATPSTVYVEAFGIARVRLGDLLAIIVPRGGR